MRRKIVATAWRNLAIAVYKAPAEGKVYGTFDADVSATMEYIRKKRDEGVRLTITHFVAAAISRALYEDVPDINCYVKRGKIIYRDDANVFVSVSIKGGKGMSGFVVPKTQELPASEIALLIKEKAEEKRNGKESDAFAAKDKIAKVPWPFRRPVFLFIRWILFEMGLPIPFLKIKSDPFGSIMLTNIGSFGLEYGMVALFPIGKLPAVVTMGRVVQKPVVIDGEIKIRWMLPFSGTFDHRIVDGAQIGAFMHGVVERLLHPEEMNLPNPPGETNEEEHEQE